CLRLSANTSALLTAISAHGPLRRYHASAEFPPGYLRVLPSSALQLRDGASGFSSLVLLPSRSTELKVKILYPNKNALLKASSRANQAGYSDLFLARSCSLDIGRYIKLFKILGKAGRQLGGSLVIGRFVFPRITRAQELRRNSGDRLWNAQTEGGIKLKFHILQLAFNRRIYHGPRVRQFHA